jgi:prepilin-type N-terminal cleavage/methylation domain-containing protein
MNKGFSFLEILVVLSLSAGLLLMLLSTVSQSVGASRKIVSHQEKMEGIFHTMNMLRSDLTKCGMRLQEAAQVFHLPLFENGGDNLRVIYGIGGEKLLEEAHGGDTTVFIERNDNFSKGKKILLFEPAGSCFEFNEITGRKGNQVTLAEGLLQPYPRNTMAVVLKEVEYKLYTQPGGPGPLKRKVNKGYFQPLLEEVTDFSIQYYPEANSVLYKIQVNGKEQLQGYVFLTHMAEMPQ